MGSKSRACLGLFALKPTALSSPSALGVQEETRQNKVRHPSQQALGIRVAVRQGEKEVNHVSWPHRMMVGQVLGDCHEARVLT